MSGLGVKERVRKFIFDNLVMGDGGGPLADDGSFLDRALIDSTGILELVAFLEETYQIKVADDEITPENLDTLARIETYVTAKQGKRAVSA